MFTYRLVIRGNRSIDGSGCWTDGSFINDNHPVEYRFMITCGDRRVETRQEARMSLKQEKRMWKRTKTWYMNKRGRRRFQDDDQTLPSAYGFWLFPIDAFGMIPEAHPDIRHEGALKRTDLAKPANVWTLTRLWDLSIQKPELCLQHLPSRPQPISMGGVSKRPSWRSCRSSVRNAAYDIISRAYSRFS